MTSIVFEGVCKRFGSIEALRDVSFTVEPGELVALLGPNGAGKTTAIEILLGLRSSDAGSVRLLGGAPRDVGVRRRLGATPQNTGFPDALKAREIAAFVASQYPHPLDIEALFADFELGDIAGRKLGDLSGGQQRRVALALAFAGDADVVVLDEPTTGLDVESRQRLWEQLRKRARGDRTVLFTTHYIEEAESMASRVLVIDRGRLVFDGTPRALRDKFGARRIEYTGAQGRVSVTTPDADDFVRELVRSQAAFSDLQVIAPSLEEAFLAITGGSK